jgi:hypothetical protein
MMMVMMVIFRGKSASGVLCFGALWMDRIVCGVDFHWIQGVLFGFFSCLLASSFFLIRSVLFWYFCTSRLGTGDFFGGLV